jgi:hypothetical protein
VSATITRREAVIFYGYVFDPDQYYDNHPDTEAVAKAILAESGITDPFDTFPEGADYRTWAEQHQAETDAYRDAWITVEAALPVGTGTHGSDAVATDYLYVTGSRRNTPRTAPKAVPSADPMPVTGRQIDPAWKHALDQFLASQNITPPTGDNQPGWWSAAYEDRD